MSRKTTIAARQGPRLAAAVAAMAAAICILGPPGLARAATVAPSAGTTIVSSSPASALPSSASTSPNATSRTSTNWAGWADLANRGVQFQSVAAQFKVPRVTCAAKNRIASFWVGLDGVASNSKTVEQAGVDAICDIRAGSGWKPRYVDWYEMYPKNTVVRHVVSAGDTIVAAVAYNSSARRYFIEVDDRTHPGNGFTTPGLACPSGRTCRNSSAEVIAEDPGGGPKKGFFLVNFGTVHFSQVEVISRSGVIGSLEGNSLWSANKFTMEYPGKTVMAQPSARSSGGTAFSATYHSKG